MRRLTAGPLILAVVLCAVSSLAAAQSPAVPTAPSTAPTVPEPDGSRVSVVVSAWRPGPGLRLSGHDDTSQGTPIDLRDDVGMPARWQPAIRADVRFAARHRVRAEYLCVSTDGRAMLTRDLRYLGRGFAAGDTVTSSMDWRIYRLGYERTVIQRARTTAGATIDLRHSNLGFDVGSTSGRSRIPMPAVGGTIRVVVTPRLTLQAEGSGFIVPDNDAGTFGGRFVDAGAYATWRMASTWSMRGGVRTIDIRHLGQRNEGRGRLTGLDLGAVFRF